MDMSNPNAPWCQCENICHMDDQPRVTSKGRTTHDYGAAAETSPVVTPFGTFHVCAQCKTDCLHDYIVREG